MNTSCCRSVRSSSGRAGAVLSWQRNSGRRPFSMDGSSPACRSCDGRGDRRPWPSTTSSRGDIDYLIVTEPGVSGCAEQHDRRSGAVRCAARQGICPNYFCHGTRPCACRRAHAVYRPRSLPRWCRSPASRLSAHARARTRGPAPSCPMPTDYPARPMAMLLMRRPRGRSRKRCWRSSGRRLIERLGDGRARCASSSPAQPQGRRTTRQPSAPTGARATSRRIGQHPRCTTIRASGLRVDCTRMLA